jgi:isoleucyl-tRNA synthetase
MSETTTPNYKQTLNLPKTSFPMRANLAQNEPQTEKRWDKAKLYAQILSTRKDEGAPPFVFHDGPPYANGSIHVGHLLNKVLKDIVVRSRTLMGQHCPYIPGWDCHGLPIEHRVMTELVESGKVEKLNTLTDDQRRIAVRRECAKYAEKFVKLQSQQLKRLLTLADYDDPYITMQPRYEKAVLEVFAELVSQGLVYRALKPVHWSIANQTALAEAELEYEDREDPSIYVDFEVLDRTSVEAAFGVELDATPSLMIWTTTPWTLPANLAVAVHERYRYALVQVDGNVTIVASDLVERVTKAAGAEAVEILAECDGAALVGIAYRHPFMPSHPTDDTDSGAATRKVVAAEYVTLEDGTGLVHTAPGHGQEDYQTGLREGLEVYCPVRGDGTFDDTVPQWLRGVSVWDANKIIIDRLNESGHMFHWHMFNHSYPHDWRSKTPVIFRGTEQWFVGVDQSRGAGDGTSQSLRAMALDAVSHSVRFIPEWGRNRMRGMLESRPDWCLSRQRAWGLPIPAFFNEDGEVLLTPAMVKAVAEKIGEKGSDVWFAAPPEALLEGYDPANDPDAPAWARTIDPASLQKANDIFDVWFESGSSWHAVMRQRELGYPSDLYLEGSDQHRGWFQLSLLPAMGVTGHAPFKTVLTHGFMVDKDGRKMSKSGGNALDVDVLLKDFGADVCRWWVCSLAYENDIKVDPSFFSNAGEEYRKVRNTIRFLLSNLNDFDPQTSRVELTAADNTSIDAAAMDELNKLLRTVRDGYEQFAFRKVHGAIYKFCNETMSAWYMDATKDRLYCDEADSPRRRRTQTVMFDIAHALVRLIAPIMPHTADEAWAALHNVDVKDAPSVHLELFPVLREINVDARWAEVFKQREKWLKAIEDARQSRDIDNRLDVGLRIAVADDRYTGFDLVDLADVCGVSRFELVQDAAVTTERVEVIDLREEPRCERSWKRDGTVKQRSDGGWLTDRDARAVGV